MAARPGEENVATLFGDIHYFYSPEDVRPRHHRFDKGSYVYLFENANERRCRVEIANNPGAADQDAFDGFLDQTRVWYSYKQHCMVSLTVADVVNQSEWHLPTYDPRNENKYHYKLHSVDIYFWTQQDALQFVNGVRRVLPPAQVEVLDEPGPPSQQPAQQPAGISQVVQKLESAAISDPQYNTSKHTSQASQDVVPPPPPGAPGAAAMPPPPPQPANFVPMAYNPAAPAAPESIRPREKTPPPDEDPLNPLAVAVAYDYQGQPFTPAYHGQFPPGVTSPGMPPSGLASPGFPGGVPPGSPGHPGMHRAATMPANMGLASPGLLSPYGSSFPQSQTGIPPPPPPQSQPPPQMAQPQAPNQPTPPVTSPGLPPPPPGGYSNYSYNQPGQPVQGGGYSIHQQLYRPTEEEAGGKEYSYQPKQEPRGKLEENAGKLERGVSGMLKKFEKKFG